MKTNNTYLFQKTQFFQLGLFLFACLFIFSCKSNDHEAVIHGKIKNAKSKEVSLELLSPMGVKLIKKVKILDDSNFEIKIDTIVNSFYRLKIDENNFIYLRIKNNDKILINAVYPNIAENYSIEGSEDCSLLKEMNTYLLNSTKKLNEINNQLVEAYSIDDYNLDSLYNSLNEQARQLYKQDKEFLINFIKNNDKSAVIYMALYQYISVSPILIINNDLEIFQFVLDKLKENNPNLEQLALLEAEVSKETLRQQQFERDYKKLQIGEAVPDFDLPDISGKRTYLSQFKGNTVLIAFWSSWNKNSVKEIIKLSQNLKNTNIIPILISLDNNKEKWENSVKINSLENYVNLSDLRSWESLITKIYALRSIPTFFLIDKNGVLLCVSDNFDEINLKIKEK